jgi:murein DD-endopeptidase MepM/ murein hydrolase activator NlpD
MLLVLLLPLVLPVAVLALAAGAGLTTVAHQDCGGRPVPVPLPLPGADTVSGVGLDETQLANAALIVAATRAFPPTRDTSRAAVIALATAMTESGLRNVRYGDRDSLGLFQQRPSQGWGTPAQVLRPGYATRRFLRGLVAIAGWQHRRLTDVAAQVQRPAAQYRGRYQQWEPMATDLTARLWGPSGPDPLVSVPAQPGDPPGSVRAGGMVAGGCVPTSSEVVFPLPATSGYVDQRNWHDQGSSWGSWHTGTDLSVACGTPVLAATSGTVEVDTGQPWAGRWLVRVSPGPGRVSTWYAHLHGLTVADGQRVRAGVRIGIVGGDSPLDGNASGCHLHFEVHSHGGSIYGPDNVNPTIWLAEHV